MEQSPTYRNFLQSLADVGNTQATALLGVVGDDGRVNDFYQSNGGDVGGPGYTYDKTTVNSLNANLYDKYQNKYYPDRPATQTGLNTGMVSGANTGNGTSYDPQELQSLDQQKSLYERLLQSIDSTEQNGLTSLQDSENAARNKANTQQSRALEDFGMKRQTSEAGKNTALNTVGDNSRMLRDSLMRKLGLGAGGGSAFQMGDQAVARDASKNRAGVLNSYGENDRSLAVSEKRTNEDYSSLLDEILADRRNKEQQLKAGVYGQRQNINESLGQISADRARLMGGSQLQAAAPYRNNYLQLQSQVDALPSQYRTAVDARALNVQTPTLRDYVVDRAAINQSKQSGQQQYSPYSAFLKKSQDELTVR